MTLKSIFSLKLREGNKNGAYADPQGSGVRTTHWFWGAADRIERSQDQRQSECAEKVKSLSECIGKVMGKSLEGCGRSKEADSSSGFPATLAAKSKESNISIIASRFREASGGQASPSIFRVTLIKEGLGNFADAFYYTREALQSGVELFTGLKIMADHPTLEEEEIRPERSTRDVLGHYDNLAVEEDDDGCAILCGDVDTLDGDSFEWARSIMVRAVENSAKFPDKPFIGLSINASGGAEKMGIDDVIKQAPDAAKAKLLEAKEKGVEIVRVVQKLNRAVSCDLVTEAGAGGEILTIIEGDKSNGKSKKR